MADNRDDWQDIGHDDWEDVDHSQQVAVATIPRYPTPLTEEGIRSHVAKQALEGLANKEQISRALNNQLSLMAGGGLSKAVPALGSGIVSAIGEGGALGSAQSPDDRLKGFLTGGAIQGGAAALGKLAGKAGDYAMQIATNRKKYTPGVGTELADQGLWGTEGMLKNQVRRKLGEQGAKMGEIAESIPGAPISARDVGGQISEELSSPISGGGRLDPAKLSAADRPDLSSIREFSEDVMSRGDETVKDALARRAAAGARAWRGKENPLQSLTGKLSKAEQKAYSQAIKAADPSGELARADRAYAALARARAGLDQEASLPKSLMGVLSLGANKLPGGSLAASTVGQLGTKAKPTLEEFLAPLARQAILNRGE